MQKLQIFLRHYIKENTYYRAVFCGHCVNDEVDRKVKKKIRYDFVCGAWEPVEIRKEESKAAIKDTLRVMAQRLDKCNHS